jgi:hypothetical protein
MMCRALLVACAALATGSLAWACGENLGASVQRIENPQFVLVYRTTPTPVAVGRHFIIDFALCPRGAAVLPGEVRVDASMPEHKHGMNYRPSVVALGAGQYRAEGLMFHMPGRWELVFELRGGETGSGTGAAPQRLVQTLQVG